jgi:hypothetical protein
MTASFGGTRTEPVNPEFKLKKRSEMSILQGQVHSLSGANTNHVDSNASFIGYSPARNDNEV